MQKRVNFQRWIGNYMAMFTAMCVFAVTMVRMYF